MKWKASSGRKPKPKPKQQTFGTRVKSWKQERPQTVPKPVVSSGLYGKKGIELKSFSRVEWNLSQIPSAQEARSCWKWVHINYTMNIDWLFSPIFNLFAVIVLVGISGLRFLQVFRAEMSVTHHTHKQSPRYGKFYIKWVVLSLQFRVLH